LSKFPSFDVLRREVPIRQHASKTKLALRYQSALSFVPHLRACTSCMIHSAPPLVGSRMVVRFCTGHPLVFGFYSQTRGTREIRRTLCESTGFLKVRGCTRSCSNKQQQHDCPTQYFAGPPEAGMMISSLKTEGGVSEEYISSSPAVREGRRCHARRAQGAPGLPMRVP
jgi:hypothetical protein